MKLTERARAICTAVAVQDEDGAITVDWVVLTAAVVILGVVVIGIISGGVYQAGSDIYTGVLSSTAL
ncbi:MAG: hypothetical protein AAGE76_00105 [Pseudomonadota bacterium]